MSAALLLLDWLRDEDGENAPAALLLWRVGALRIGGWGVTNVEVERA